MGVYVWSGDQDSPEWHTLLSVLLWAPRAADCAWASVQSREFRDLGRVEGWMCSATPVLR